MSMNERQIWMELRLLSRANQEVAAQGDRAGSLDPHKWIFKHLGQCPKEFAYEDWSQYQPAFQKIRLVPFEEAGLTRRGRDLAREGRI